MNTMLQIGEVCSKPWPQVIRHTGTEVVIGGSGICRDSVKALAARAWPEAIGR